MEWDQRVATVAYPLIVFQLSHGAAQRASPVALRFQAVRAVFFTTPTDTFCRLYRDSLGHT